ncbi:MAG: peptide deformylase [Candidatus Saccharimonadales bacterium]
MVRQQKKLKIYEFGNPILRENAKSLTIKDIKATKIQKLIKEMQEFILSKKMGVGLAAPQIGKSLALAVVCIRPIKHRKEAKEFDLVIINPQIIKTYGNRIQQWEGCISAGPLKSGLFAKVPRYKRIELKYHDEKGKQQKKTFEGLAAHIIQHEVDHINGILFVDKVKDTKTFITYNEYIKLAKKKK